MQQTDPFIALAVLIAAALVGGMIAHRMRQPVILGYLAVGVAVGPHAIGLVGDLEIVETVATIGVTLLVFTLGMEVSLSQLREVGKIGIWGGMLQIIAVIGLGIFAGYVFLGWPLSQSVLFGLIISLSSTAICLKILMDRGELSSIQGRIMLALLILQDISVIFMTLALPLLAGQSDNLATALIYRRDLRAGKMGTTMAVRWCWRFSFPRTFPVNRTGAVLWCSCEHSGTRAFNSLRRFSGWADAAANPFHAPSLSRNYTPA